MFNNISGILNNLSDAEAARGYIIVPRELIEGLLSICRENASAKLDQLLNEHLADYSKKLSPNNKLLHLIIRHQRKKYKISQTALASRAMVKQPDISEFETNGTSGFERDRKQRIINALKELISEKLAKQ